MRHIFVLENNLYIDRYESAEAEQALLNGTYRIKVDGANHMVHHETDGIELYERYDSPGHERAPNGCIDIPPGENERTYLSKEKRHTYFYKRPISLDTVTKLSKAYRMMEDAAIRYCRDKPHGFYSVEAVGKKFHRTPGVEVDGALAFHHDQTLAMDTFSGFESTKKFLMEDVCIEGIVVEYNAKFWKIRSNCFDKSCNYEKMRRTKVTPDNFIGPRLAQMLETSNFSS